MAENFDLIFGQGAATQTAWSDADYQNGWGVVGSTPPTAQQFDAIHRRADKKMQELNNRLTPLESAAESSERQPGTAYTAGTVVASPLLPDLYYLLCTAGGTSGNGAITIPDPLVEGTTITDGTTTWTVIKVPSKRELHYRQPSTAYAKGDIVYHADLPGGFYLECTTAGTTGDGDLSIGGV